MEEEVLFDLRATPRVNNNLNETKKKSVKKRSHWKNKTEFLLTTIGYTTGIGSVIRFPYVCYRNGGGAFLIPYTLILVICGIPLFYLESILGQFSSTGCTSVFRICPLLKGVGFAMVIVSTITAIYYNVLISLPFVFLYNCLQENLPWEKCDNEWNTEYCVQHGIENNLTYFMNMSNYLKKTPADEFFHNKVLEISSNVEEIGGFVSQVLIANILSWIIIYLCISRGIHSVGKVVYFTATFPFLILFVLFIRGITLPGAIDGIWYFIYPDWKHLTSLKTWLDASNQVLFSIGPGWGGLINMCSFNHFRNDLKRDAILIPLVGCFTAIFAGFVVFSVLGFMAHTTGLPVSSVATGGPGLAFITYPEAISMLPYPHFWAVLFFIMLYLLGIDTVFALIEIIVTSVMDEKPQLRPYKIFVTFLACFVFCLFSLPFTTNGGMYYLTLFDWYCSSISLVLICLLEVIIVGWIYGINNFMRDVKFMINKGVSKWWLFCWKYLTAIILIPLFLSTIFFNTEVTYNTKIYPSWVIWIGWVTCVVSIIVIPAVAIYKIIVTPGTFTERMQKNLRATSDWGPSDGTFRRQWLTLVQRTETKEINLNETKYTNINVHDNC